MYIFLLKAKEKTYNVVPALKSMSSKFRLFYETEKQMENCKKVVLMLYGYDIQLNKLHVY